MDAYFAFTDECGNYQKNRSDRAKKAHPFYVRSTVILSLDDYLELQKGIDDIKLSFGLQPNVEIKWAHYGSTLKKNYKNIPHKLTTEQLKEYYQRVLTLLTSLKSTVLYYTLTDNTSIKKVSEVSLLKMHLQNAYQRVQAVMSDKEGFSIVVADDLNDKTKELKQAVYELTLAGDYVQYTNIKKGLYIDFSDQCHGLQIADICAGTLTASLKYEAALEHEKHKYQLGHDLLFTYVYKKIRSSFFSAPYYEVYTYGIKEVPNGAGKEIAQVISRQIENNLEKDLAQELYELYN